MSGADVCSALRADPRFPVTVPIIVMAAGSDSRAHKIEAYRAGAWEVCAEPLDMEVLLHKLDRYLDAKFFADQVRDQSLIDADTGLYNYRGFTRRAKELGADVARRGDGMSCLAFAPTSDSLAGSTAVEGGDVVLSEYMGGVCRRSTRLSDVVGRVGPSEFAVLAPAASEDGVRRLGERIQEVLQANPLTIDGNTRSIEIRMVQSTIANLADAPIDAMDLVRRATSALRGSSSGPQRLSGQVPQIVA